MNAAILRQLTEELCAGGVGLMVDTNALRTSTQLFNLSEKIQKWNLCDPERLPVQLCVSQLVCAERLFQLKRQHQGRYDRDLFLQQFQSKGIVQEAFDAPHAARFAELMHAHYKSDGEWRRFKLDWYCQRLGLTDKSLVKSTGRGCSATVDWFIMVQAGTGNRWLITEDAGPEFRELDRKVSLSVVERALADLLESTSAPTAH